MLAFLIHQLNSNNEEDHESILDNYIYVHVSSGNTRQRRVFGYHRLIRILAKVFRYDALKTSGIFTLEEIHKWIPICGGVGVLIWFSS
jgi:hypothetical protein